MHDALGWIESPDRLYDFFSAMQRLLVFYPNVDGADACLDGSSVPGVYIRQRLLQVQSNPFSVFARFFDSLQAYVLGDDIGRAARPPPRQLEARLHREAVALQREVGSAEPERIERRVAGILREFPGMPQAHFVRYLCALRRREFCVALDALHAYFDYSVARSSGRRRFRSPERPSEKSPGARQTALVTQYAIFNVGLLHFHFHHTAQALQAIHETVRIAQQNGDHACLMHALALLCRIATAKGDFSYAGQLLQRCIATQAKADAVRRAAAAYRTAAPGAGPLEAPRAERAHRQRAERARAEAAAGGFARVGGAAGDSAAAAAARYMEPQPVPPVDSQSWLAVARFQLQELSQGLGASNPPAVWASVARSVELNTMFVLEQLTGTAALLRATAWNLFGSAFLSRVWTETHLFHHYAAASHADRAAALCSLAASPHAPPGAARAALRAGRDAYPRSAQSVPFAEMELHARFDRLLAAGDLAGARAAADGLGELVPHTPDSFELQVGALFAEARLAFAEGRLHRAFQDAVTLIRACDARRERVVCVRLLLFVARIHQTAGDSASALPFVLRCLSLCKNYNLDGMACEASLALARLQLNLGAAGQAVASVRRVLPRILEQCQARVAAEAFHLLALAFHEEGDRAARNRAARDWKEAARRAELEGGAAAEAEAGAAVTPAVRRASAAVVAR